jgi:putative transposase
LKYAFILENQPSWPVAVLCEVLGVGRSGFYDYQKRQAAPLLSPEDIALLERIKAISEKTNHSYGSRRMTTQLQDEG